MKGGMVGFEDGWEDVSVQVVIVGCCGNILYWEGTMCTWLCPIVNGIIGEHGHDCVKVFVIHHTKDNAFLRTLLTFDLLGEIGPSTNVVSCVANHQWISL